MSPSFPGSHISNRTLYINITNTLLSAVRVQYI